MDNNTKAPIKLLLIILFLSLSTIVMAQNDNDKKKNDHLLSIEVAAIYPQYWGKYYRSDDYNTDLGFEVGAFARLDDNISIGVGYDRTTFSSDLINNIIIVTGSIEHLKVLFVYKVINKQKFNVQISTGPGYVKYIRSTSLTRPSPFIRPNSKIIEGYCLALDASISNNFSQNLGLFLKVNHYIERITSGSDIFYNDSSDMGYTFYPSIGIRYSLL